MQYHLIVHEQRIAQSLSGITGRTRIFFLSIFEQLRPVLQLVNKSILSSFCKCVCNVYTYIFRVYRFNTCITDNVKFDFERKAQNPIIMFDTERSKRKLCALSCGITAF